MIARILRLLCLGCGLLLALPPAWCCWTSQPAPQAEPAHASCCHKEATPTQAPLPTPTHCPCDDIRTVTPAGPAKVAADLALPALLATAVVETPRAGAPADVAPIPPPLSRPLHLLRCVWLC
jgi:hypothetical protein